MASATRTWSTRSVAARLPHRPTAVALVLLLATVVAGASAQAVASQARSTVRVLTFNIHHGAGADGAVDLDRIARVVRVVRPDVVGLQEVDRHLEQRSAFADQASELARILHMHVVFGANVDLDPPAPGEPRRQYGTALLTREPILDWDNTPLPRTADHEQRGLLRARVLVRGRPLQVHVTHLQHDDAAERLAQARAIVALLDRSRDPVVLLGDLNAEPGTPEITALTSRLTDSWTPRTGSGYSHPAAMPEKRIDYVLSSPDLPARDTAVVTTPDAVAASDHLPVVAVLTLPRR
jgi:endonuclease/exonuclease/phosphatase family metal-dependent hydrolase